MDRSSLIVQPFPGGVTAPPVVVPPTMTGGYSLGLLLTLTTAGTGAPPPPPVVPPLITTGTPYGLLLTLTNP